MKVRIAYTVEVEDDTRRGMRRYYGQPGLATRDEVQQWFWMFGHSMNDDIPTPGTPYMGDDEGT